MQSTNNNADKNIKCYYYYKNVGQIINQSFEYAPVTPCDVKRIFYQYICILHFSNNNQFHFVCE